MSYKKQNIRLTKDFIPSHYEIRIDLDIINLSYISKVEIFITSQIDNPKYISLNSKFYSKQGKLTNYKLIKEGQNNSLNYIIEKLDKSPDDYTNTISSIYFTLKEGIKKGETLIFKCEKNDEIKISTEGYGLYISFWDYKLRKLLDKKIFNKNNYISFFKDKNNPTIEEIQNNFNYFKSLVISLNSSPVGLREVIPCFDEPLFKATYKLTLSVNKNIANSSKNFTVVNNSEIEKIIEEKNKKIYCFKKTPKMSTYLLTFTIGFYEYIEKYINKNNNKEKLRLRVYGPENQMKKVEYIIPLTEDALQKYEKIFNYPYILDKLDSIFIPNLNFTAMEFLGCITYKQELMYDIDNTHAIWYRYCIKDTYHEVFHNWIGNLTTMEFFDNTWLNEGLTKFMEIYITLNFGKAFFDENMRYSYYYTLTYRDHPLNNNLIYDENSIWTNFDNVTYEKGGYIIYMLIAYFGEEKIYKGLKIFFDKYKFSSANEIDFFNAMSEACNYDIKDFLKEWIYERSFPILYVYFSENKNEIIIEQKPNVGDNNVIFKLPIFFKTKNIENIIFMKEKKISLKLSDYNITYEDICNKDNFIVFNSDIKCFCVVNYDEDILKDAIFSYYNKYNEKKDINNYEKRVNDADIFQILISHYHIGTSYKLKLDVAKLKNIKNFEILNYIYENLYISKKTNKFFEDDINEKNNNIIQEYNKLKYELIDYNNTKLIKKILDKFDIPGNSQKEEESGEIDYEKYFILFLCLFKKDENIIKKIFDIFEKNNYDFYKINKNYRCILPIIINEFMYLFPEKEKIKVYKSMEQYNEEMYYNFYYLEKSYFQDALINFNNGFSFEILDYYFEKNEIDSNSTFDDIIVDYFYWYLNQLYLKNKGENNKSFQDYLYEIVVIKKFDINDKKFDKIENCYNYFIDKIYPKEKLLNYCDEKYLHFKDFNDKDKIEEIKNLLNLL